MINAAARDSLLIDFSPPRSPSLAASGSDGMSVNSIGSESSIIDAPISSFAVFKPEAPPTVAPAPPTSKNFDPFGSIEEEVVTPVNNSSGFHQSQSCDFFAGNQFSEAISGPCYDSNFFNNENGSSIPWNSSKATLSSAPDPFSPPPAPSTTKHIAKSSFYSQETSSINGHAPNASSGTVNGVKPIKKKPTIIRPKNVTVSCVSRDASIETTTPVAESVPLPGQHDQLYQQQQQQQQRVRIVFIWSIGEYYWS